MEKIMNEVICLIQGHTDRVLKSINPVSNKDLPFIAFALKSVLRALEKNMDNKQKNVYEAMSHIIGVRDFSIHMKAGTEELLNNFDKQEGGGIVNGV